MVVSDSGEGMPTEITTRLFDRGRGARQGLPVADDARHGLGLIIAQEIVLQHGGEISVESSVGKGSAFTVLLPLDRESDPVTAMVRKEPSGGRHRSR
jgi:signal transduction histidine kinase